MAKGHTIYVKTDSRMLRGYTPKFDIRFKDNKSPFRLAVEWDPILDIVLPLSSQLDDSFTRGRVTTEGVKKTVPNFTGIFASIANLQEETFKAFAGKIEMA